MKNLPRLLKSQLRMTPLKSWIRDHDRNQRAPNHLCLLHPGPVPSIPETSKWSGPAVFYHFLLKGNISALVLLAPRPPQKHQSSRLDLQRTFSCERNPRQLEAASTTVTPGLCARTGTAGVDVSLKTIVLQLAGMGLRPRCRLWVNSASLISEQHLARQRAEG